MTEPLKINKKSYLLTFEKILNNFCQNIQDYIKNPNDENIHDVRITVRRLQAAYRVLPKNSRSMPKIRGFLKQSIAFFKLNTKIRDFDIICQKMEAEYQVKTRELVAALRNSRIENLRSATKLAKKILYLKTPKISSSILKEPKLNKRYLKILHEIKLDIQKNTINALMDERKIEELHMLRKNYKKLRYSLELAENKKKTTLVLKSLREIQDILGEIHDNDIIIDYLLKIEKHSKYSDVLESEVLERTKKYNAFVSAFKKRKLKTSNFNL
jgi:CHAD domain-containing protein